MHVIVRPPSTRFREAVSDHPRRASIDPERAAAQHAAFVAAVAAAGAGLVRLPAEPELPDAPFVSDVLVALAPPRSADPRTALIVVARPALESRRPEVPTVVAAARECLGRPVVEVAVPEPETLEGGDVVICGDRLFVGVSRRTTEAGARLLGRAAATLGYVPYLCPVSDRLHLATAVTAIGARELIGTAAGFASLEAGRPVRVGDGRATEAASRPLAGIRRVTLPDAESAAANVLALGDTCLLASGNPGAVRLLRAAGRRPVELELDEFELADGGPTCLVNLIP